MRIASLSPAVTEILFALSKEKDIVCVDWYSDNPEAAKALPRLKEHQKIRADELRKFRPEIVFTSTLVQEKLAKKLREAGFTVIHQDPRSLQEIEESIREIGTLLECEARAGVLCDSIRRNFNDVKRKAGFLSRKPKVYIEEWHNPPMASGNWVPEVVRIAGGNPLEVKSEKLEVKSVESDDKRRSSDLRNPSSREVTLEEVRTFDPDLIVLSICGAGPAASKDLLTNRVGWKDLRAVRENHLFVIDDSLLNRPGPRLPEGAMRVFGWCFQVLH